MLDYSFSFNYYWDCQQGSQGCALADPAGPLRLTFALGRLGNLSLLVQIICWAYARFYSFRALGSLQFSLDHSLGCILLLNTTNVLINRE